MVFSVTDEQAVLSFVILKMRYSLDVEELSFFEATILMAQSSTTNHINALYVRKIWLYCQNEDSVIGRVRHYKVVTLSDLIGQSNFVLYYSDLSRRA